MQVTAQDVADFLGQGNEPTVVALAEEHLPLVTAMANRYTRGNGFTSGAPSDSIAAVLITATARLMANPAQLATDIGEVSIRGGFNGWTLPELAVLNSYRKRAT